ncbi:putative synaptobrevin [Encephalitozoon hellem]|uniref:Synaptobrevin n=1 Tax=Encephalitozoon hellem TaxID=27973 RepID=A0A9Q9C809_ENCHE|nr:uncharacterized protein EHEL_050560 [Encephalitozoon hellem ATCC 50504]AFM98267.1 hypothetical protein EHEL_050560 [Encephalitozoon hellem ATCC 50504]KAG5859664.1 putative synaptobrevin [Encephalitozoon hellem]UTX43145.1 hypothetical protein GPU96_05g08840 [Encephalitozoon hellem]WEL38602.1 putative synaptobrevin [Encephalitozoon hellem]|eukprot:XP_003887248.1 hypothetical protein EHEL_050560 [Encephalitozoon hellem ATCC 50504]
MGDEVTEKIEKEVKDLQGVLKEQLKTQRDLGDLETNLKSETFTLEKTTEEHKAATEEAKKKLFWKNFKYFLIAGIIVVLILFGIFGNIFKG